MGIFSWFKKKEPEKAAPQQQKTTNSIGEDLDRLTPRGDIPYGWAYANRDFISKRQDEYNHFLKVWCDSKAKAPKEKYAALKSYVTYMKDLKRICASKGECFALYCSDVWANDKEIEKYESELKHIEDNFDDLEDSYQRDLYIKECILPQLPSIIRDKPGILQTDIYKMFPADCKGPISSELYNLGRSGRIIREKSGRSYSLKIKA